MLASMAPFTALLLVAASCLVRLVQAVPLFVSESRRDVANPPVTAPNASTVWVVGETQTVIWDTSNLPEQITNTQGTVLLGFMNDTTSNEHLMIDNPLASGFDIRSGSVTIVVPDVEPRTDYIIALLGDSGNISDKFTIKSSNTSTPSPTSPTSSSVVSTSESSLSSEPTETQLNTSSTSSVASPLPTQTSTLTVAAPASSGTSEGLSQQTSTPASTLADQTNPSPSTSGAAASMIFSRYIHLVLPAISMILLL